jgi:hypothetical protein
MLEDDLVEDLCLKWRLLNYYLKKSLLETIV